MEMKDIFEKNSSPTSFAALDPTNGPYALADVFTISNFIVTSITIPIYATFESNEDGNFIFTMYKVSNSLTGLRSKVKEIYEIAINAEEYALLENSVVRAYITVDLSEYDIVLTENQSLAFCAVTDTIIPAYIKTWEIWNEPENGRECWDGPFEDFLELFVIAAKHLKSKFPHLKIGGPAFATGGVDKRKDDFLKYMKERDVPLDFFSWHTYKSEACKYEKRIYAVRESLDRAGYTETESILNEWTYIINWHEGLRESIKTIISTKGAAFVSAIMATGQNSPLDMMMYYDARPNWPLNCLFDFYTGDRLKGYYSFKMFSELYRLGEHVESVSDDEEIYAVAAKNSEKSAVMLTYFTNNTETESKKIELTLSGGADGYSVSLLDDNHDAESIGVFEVQNNKIQLTLEANTVVLLQSND